MLGILRRGYYDGLRGKRVRREQELKQEANKLFSNEQVLNSEFFKDVLHLRFTADLFTEQELIGKDIPLENRVSYLLPYTPIVETLSSRVIAGELDMDLGWVNRTAQSIGMVPLSEEDWGSQVEYPYVTLPLLEVERVWQEGFAVLDDFLSAGAIVGFMGTSKTWVKEVAAKLDIPAVVKKSNNHHEYQAYPKRLIPMLRHVLLSIPAQADWDSSLALSQMTGMDRKWIERQLALRGVLPIKRRANNNYRVANFYPPTVFEEHVLKMIEHRPQPAGDWLTELGMAKRLEKSQDWVRVHNAPYRYDGEIRLTTAMVPAFHYSPEVFRILKRKKEMLDAVPEVDGQLALKALAQVTGHSRAWALRRLPYIQARVVQRINSSRHLHDYFDEAVAGQLEALPNTILHHENVSHLEN